MGLIDAVGGIEMALGLLKERMDMSLDQQVSLVHYPQPKSFWTELRTGDVPGVASQAVALFGFGTPFGRQLEQAADFWDDWVRMEDDLLLCEWRY